MALILVGCEESQVVCKAFRGLGHEAYSCDYKPCSGGKPEWHLQMDVRLAIKLKKWDLAIFHPDCTYLTVSAEWAYTDGPYHQKVKTATLVGYERRIARDEAVDFVKLLFDSDIPLVAIENPVGCLSSRFRKPDQIIQPWHFGDDASKKTCLWLKGLPKLIEENRLGGDNKTRRGNQTASGQNKLPPSADRQRLRSVTYPGIATAFATQWSKLL